MGTPEQSPFLRVSIYTSFPSFTNNISIYVKIEYHDSCFRLLSLHLLLTGLARGNDIKYFEIDSMLINLSLFIPWRFVVSNTREKLFGIFKEYLKLLNRLYDKIWFGSVYA